MKPRANRCALYLSILPSTMCLILYTNWLPTTFIEGWKGIKVQVLLAYKAWISSRIALCQASYLLALVKAIGSWVWEDTTRLMGAAVAVVVAVYSVVFGYLGWRTMWCWRVVGRGGEKHVPISYYRGYDERSTQSYKPAEESMEGLVGTADPDEPTTKLVCSTADLEAWTSGDGEPILA